MSARSALVSTAVPPHAYFLVSAVFHYLGPAFAVLLFATVDVLGVAWLRIASAALVFAVWRRPWMLLWPLRPRLVALGLVLAAMNACFYLAIARLPLGTVGAIEFLGVIALAALGARTRRNLGALIATVAGVTLLTNVRLVVEPLGVVFAFANCGLFVLYVVLGHAVARESSGTPVDRLGAAMLIACIAITPFGLPAALPALVQPGVLAAGVGVGVCSSVIPYVCDQMAMTRLPRATFALLLALLPATATVVGLLVLSQLPTVHDVIGLGLILAGVLVHEPA